MGRLLWRMEHSSRFPSARRYIAAFSPLSRSVGVVVGPRNSVRPRLASVVVIVVTTAIFIAVPKRWRRELVQRAVDPVRMSNAPRPTPFPNRSWPVLEKRAPRHPPPRSRKVWFHLETAPSPFFLLVFGPSR